MAVSPVSSVRRLSKESLLATGPHGEHEPPSPVGPGMASRFSGLRETACDVDSGNSEEKTDSNSSRYVGTTRTRKLLRRSSGFWLISSYAIVVIISWAFACVLCYKPIAFASYQDQTGKYTRRQFEANDWARKVIKTSIALVGAVSIPITSAICARAVVLYCQTPPRAERKGLTARMTLALADKGWTDFKILLAALHPREGHRIRSPLLTLAVLLSGVGEPVPPISGAFKTY